VGGKHSEANAKGGDTRAKSGDAYGGDGGNAKAVGGDAHASNKAGVKQLNLSSGKRHGECGCFGKKGFDKGSSQSNTSEVRQGSPTADGGDAGAEGGYGGDADTGNKQFGNGNAYAKSAPRREESKPDWFDGKCGCRGHEHGGGEANAWGGDTSAKSGDAYGGDGGNARAVGGDAVASNRARLLQVNAPWKGGRL
jgi:hypothetical protein